VALSGGLGGYPDLALLFRQKGRGWVFRTLFDVLNVARFESPRGFKRSRGLEAVSRFSPYRFGKETWLGYPMGW
jgi:hypothetical protein